MFRSEVGQLLFVVVAAVVVVVAAAVVVVVAGLFAGLGAAVGVALLALAVEVVVAPVFERWSVIEKFTILNILSMSWQKKFTIRICGLIHCG